MTDLSAEFKALASYRPTHKVRFVTAASLFDGHDAAINIMRRILQSMGAEVIHLGHNRSVDDVVTAALQGMIGEMVMRCDKDITQYAPTQLKAIQGHGEMNWRALAQLLTAVENGSADKKLLESIKAAAGERKVPVVGITGTGGAGKSS